MGKTKTSTASARKNPVGKGRSKKKGDAGQLQREMEHINQNLSKMETKFVKKIERLEKQQSRLKNESRQKLKALKRKSVKRKRQEHPLLLDGVTQKLFGVESVGRGTPQSGIFWKQGGGRHMGQEKGGVEYGDFSVMKENLRNSIMGQVSKLMETQMKEQEERIRQSQEERLRKVLKKQEK